MKMYIYLCLFLKKNFDYRNIANNIEKTANFSEINVHKILFFLIILNKECRC